MSNYIIPIRYAFLIFPIIAGVFTIPYVLVQYHKYGSIPSLRVAIVYSFILYLISAYFLVILPLPSIEDVMKYTTPTTQFIPFQFVIDFIKNTSLVITNPSTYLKALTEPWFYQVVYNILLFIPFGMYLRYYFKCSLKKTVFCSFLLSLFFELTQLSGLYGYYPRGYRLFDVDDLMINTFGGFLGYFLTGLLWKLLPSRDKLDEYAYSLGEKISVWKRITNILLDIILVGIICAIIFIFLSIFQKPSLSLILNGVLIFYFVLVPSLCHGKTFGKSFLNMRLVDINGHDAKIYQYFARYFLLYEVIFPLPFYMIYGLSLVCSNSGNQIILLLGGIGMILFFTMIFYFISFTKMLRGNLLWYEKLSKTKNMSTIPEKRLEN